MSYENKLSEWFKQVEKRAAELARRKASSSTAQEDETAPICEAKPETARIESPAKEAAEQTVFTAVEAGKVVVDTEATEVVEYTGEARPIEPKRDPAPALFDESDVPSVDDFFAFLDKSSDRKAVADQHVDEPFRVPEDQGTLNFTEGTGEPRPIIDEPKQKEFSVPEQVPVVEVQEVQNSQASAMPQISEMPDKRDEKPTPVRIAQPAKTEPAPEKTTLEEKWGRLPRHLQTLFAENVEEVAQRSYKSFKETRAQLIERLLDPIISLEEAARILNVCPTTVRRYTNRGVLPCLRTAGNQRRFRLSDVLNFMESQTRRGNKIVAAKENLTETQQVQIDA